MAAERTSVPAADDDAELELILESDEDYWAGFDAVAREKLGISGEEFIRRVNAGDIVNDDKDIGTAFLFSMLGFVPAEKRGA